MNTEFITHARMLKAMSDENRLKILGMLKEREYNASELLEEVEFGQSTLSHHMKILVESGLVNDRKEGKWHYYSVNKETMTEFCIFIRALCKGATENNPQERCC